MKSGKYPTEVYMAKGERPFMDVFVSRQMQDGKNFYTRVGSAWRVAKDGISIKLDALPVDGSLVLFPAKDD
jgi:hypothetical protein